MHVLQCPHDVDVHFLFCFDLHLTCSQGNLIVLYIFCIYISARYREQSDQAQTYYKHAASLVPYNGILIFII